MLQIYLLAFLFSFQFTSSKQFYDPTPCSSPQFSPGSRYTCNTSLTSCKTFIVYRSRQGFETVSEITALFGANQTQVLLLNNLSNPFQILEKQREVLLPIQCSCSGGFFQVNVTYTIPLSTTYTEISCQVFEGLVKLPTLAKENPHDSNNLEAGLKLNVPLKCACPDINDTKDGFQYLVAYPIEEFDEPNLIAQKFSISLDDMLAQNSQDPEPTVFINTTILIPIRNVPFIIWNISDPSNQEPGFIPMTPGEMIETKVSQKNMYVVGFTIGIFFMLLVLLGLGFYCKSPYKWRGDKLEPLSARSSTPSCLSPDLIAGMSKYSLISYSVEELNEATRGFSEDTKLGASVHKGRIGGTEVVIKKMGFGDARRTIGIHSKINHTNIVKLEGVCYGESEFSSSYLVFEFAQHGCLRNCLRNSIEVLPWHRRTQIAFDVAIGLHYIHHCTFPSYIHMNMNSRNILITEEWRAKIANLGVASVINSSKERGSDVAMTTEGWIAPEYLHQGSVSAKLDVFAFGVVLFELLSGKEARDGSFLRESLWFLSGGGCVTGCFEELRGFVDPCLKDYPIGEALCMTVLAKACVEEDPMHRPSMNDILKILARMLR